jgi:electron transfer flavoprotein alpha subunit
MSDLKGILVVGELEEGILAPITKEMLGGARYLAKGFNDEVNLLLIGEKVATLAQEGIAFGADKVYTIESPVYRDYHCDSYTHLITESCLRIKPLLCLMGHTDLGREVAPRIAARLKAGLCMDCIEIKVAPDEKNFIQTRPVYGGKAMAELISSPGNIQIDTVRRTCMVPLVPQNRQAPIIGLLDEIDPPIIRAKLISRAKQERELELENAKIIVAGGGGIGGKEGFGIVRELAQLLGGTVGATRVPVDEKWISHGMEIGQTGKIVNPDLYIAVGISGATQHITGIIGSKYIVAINKDPDANIFRVSDLGVVADYMELLPCLIENLKVTTQ